MPKTLSDPIVVQLVEGTLNLFLTQQMMNPYTAGLQNIRNEMDTLILRVAMSPAMREQVCYRKLRLFG